MTTTTSPGSAWRAEAPVDLPLAGAALDGVGLEAFAVGGVHDLYALADGDVRFGEGSASMPMLPS